MKRILSLSLILCVVMACRQEAPPPPAEGAAPPPAPRRAAEEARASATKAAAEAEAAAVAEAAEAEKVKEMLGAHKKKREILVGGCAQRCRAPLDGFRGFVDTAELVDGEARNGRAWADLFLEGRLAERREGVETWRDGFVAEMGTLRDASELQAALDAPLDMTRRSADVVVFHFALPATDKGSGGEIWHFTFGKRGLEWLLRGIERP